jgi:hypothetical protein
MPCPYDGNVKGKRNTAGVTPAPPESKAPA